jgi:hypothetical protein
MNNATLLSHAGSETRTRAQLAALPAPTSQGRYHDPVAHIELVQMLEYSIKEKLNASIISEQFAIKRGGMTLFGVMSITYNKRDDITSAIGFRHANDRSMSLQFVAGQSVFVCDNMVLRGDTIFLREKHDVRTLNLQAQLSAGLETYVKQLGMLEQETDTLRATLLDDGVASKFILEAFVKHHVMPLTMIGKVYDAYFDPPHAQFLPRTAWSLHNAFTEVMKLQPITPRMESTQQLGKLMGLASV